MAAIYWHSNAYDTKAVYPLLGRHSAGEGFLGGVLRHGGGAEIALWNAADEDVVQAEAIVRRIAGNDRPIRWIGRTDLPGLARSGVVSLPVPGLGKEAWGRRAVGDRAYSLVGLTHTIATSRVQDLLAEYPIAPVQPWDALVCTSRPALRALEVAREAVTEHLQERLGATRITWPQYAHIPLGVQCARFAPDPAARAMRRAALGIGEGEVGALYFGRFNPFTKMALLPMQLALERAAARTSTRLHWILCGRAEEHPEKIEQGLRLHENRVKVHLVDGRGDEAEGIWSAADVFLSLSDNVQETFGLTPLEAMAAGLPCVVSDWDGYKDTVRHGVDGFRVATTTPAAGLGRDLALAGAQDWLPYPAYVGGVAQFTAVDIDAAAAALLELVASPDLRRRMGEAARLRAAEFDWRRIIPRHEALWSELNERRAEAPAEAPRTRNLTDNPFRIDPFRMFASYPTEWATPTTMVQGVPGVTPQSAAALLDTPYVRVTPERLPNLDEVRVVLETLSARPQMELAALLALFPPGRRPVLERGVVWLAKYGLLRLLGRSSAIGG